MPLTLMVDPWDTGLTSDDDAPTALSVRVLLVLRHAIVREGARRILESETSTPGFNVVGEAVSLATALPLIETLKPDALVLGLDPAEVESRGYLRLLRGLVAGLRILVLDYGIPPERLARLGITGWISGTASPVELVAGVRAVAEGRPVSGNPTTIGASDERLPVQPTRRELEVLTLIEQGLVTRAIADRLQTTTRTIHFHVGNLFAKLGARSRTELVHLARRRGWLD